MRKKEMCFKKYKNQYPGKMAKRKEVLSELLLLFDFDEIYDEQDVNKMISKYFPGDQYCEIRRDLIGLGYLERNSENQTYWRSKQ